MTRMMIRLGVLSLIVFLQHCLRNSGPHLRADEPYPLAPGISGLEPKSPAEFKKWVETSFVGKPVLYILDYYKFPLGDTAPAGGNSLDGQGTSFFANDVHPFRSGKPVPYILDYYNLAIVDRVPTGGSGVDRWRITFFPHDEHHLRSLTVHFKAPPGVPFRGGDSLKYINRKTLGSLLVTNIAVAIKAPRERSKYSTEEWKAVQSRICERTNKWEKEVASESDGDEPGSAAPGISGEPKSPAKFEKWVETTFVGKPVLYILDYYRLPLADVIWAGGNGVDLWGITFFPDDEHNWRELMVQFKPPPGAPFLGEDNEKYWNRKCLGSFVVKRIALAIKSPRDRSEYSPEEWKELQSKFRERRNRWEKELRESAVLLARDEASSAETSAPGRSDETKSPDEPSSGQSTSNSTSSFFADKYVLMGVIGASLVALTVLVLLRRQ